jgi:hypothetical protein
MSTSAGYSKRSLADKLGIKGGYRVAILNAPDNYLSQTLIDLPDITLLHTLDGSFELIQFFTKEADTLAKEFTALKAHLQQAGSLWISWPKLSSKVTTDLTEGIIREIGLNAGLVDVKVCAVDQVWSGLKFVYRLKDRK